MIRLRGAGRGICMIVGIVAASMMAAGNIGVQVLTKESRRPVREFTLMSEDRQEISISADEENKAAQNAMI